MTHLMAKQTILVVDDEPAIRDMVSTLLARHGYSLDCAENAVEAMNCLKKGRVAPAILDVVLPDGDGVHLATLIKRMDPALFMMGLLALSSWPYGRSRIRSGAVPPRPACLRQAPGGVCH